MLKVYFSCLIFSFEVSLQEIINLKRSRNYNGKRRNANLRNSNKLFGKTKPAKYIGQFFKVIFMCGSGSWSCRLPE